MLSKVKGKGDQEIHFGKSRNPQEIARNYFLNPLMALDQNFLCQEH